MGSSKVGMLVPMAIIMQFVGIKAANILAILTTPTRSHHNWNTPLMLSLASRGHHVTIVSPVALTVPVPNITDIVLEGSLDYTNEEADYASMTKINILEKLSLVKDWYLSSCQYSLSTNGAKTLMEYTKNTTFDLYIIEASGGECFFGFLHKFGRAPIVAINGFGSPEWINYNIGSPYNPSYITSSFLNYDYPSGLWQRIQNTLIYSAAMFLYHYSYLPSQDALIRKHFGEGVPPVKETLNNVSVLLVSYHHSFDGPRPLVPAMIPVGGIHIKKPKPLPKDIQTYLDDAKDGVIFFSLGSIVRSDRMSEDRIQLFLEAFAELPQKVLWKWESDSLPGQPKNVKLGKWLPQNDILAHPNIRLFISHSGLLSTHEAIYHAVPVVGMPFIVDQHTNIEKIASLGLGEKLDYLTLTKDMILSKIRKVIEDPKYRENMKRISAQFRDNPEPPLERAVYWTEYVLRHQGAEHLRAASLDMPLYQYLLLDVVAVLLGSVVVVLVVIWLAARTILRAILRTDKVKQQ
ncbi:UDP-glycosyltransferase UGT5 [Anabrus simplex]|uniref:UDP-glycosyltransferase UGT5 n=1 Tax=Anabrus simplex TaxID=316456 RepID=UPI0035A3BB15